jgi:hypothetical protein
MDFFFFFRVVTGLTTTEDGEVKEVKAIDRTTGVVSVKTVLQHHHRRPHVWSMDGNVSVSLPPDTRRPSLPPSLLIHKGREIAYKADAVIFAIGIGGMQKLGASCPSLAAADEFRAVMNLKSLDVIATRIWLDKKVKTRQARRTRDPCSGG